MLGVFFYIMIPEDNLRACSEHGVVKDNGYCPSCELSVEARPSAVSGESFGQVDLRWQIENDVMDELVSLLQRELEDQDLFISVAEVGEGDLAAGYTRQEKWFNVVVIAYSTNSREIISRNQNAMEVIEDIKNGDYEVPEEEDSHWLLEPSQWKGVLGPYVRDFEEDVEFEEEESVLIMRVNVFDEDIHSELRREVGLVCSDYGASVSTVNAGSAIEDSVIKIKV